jgi:hypothetical protein
MRTLDDGARASLILTEIQRYGWDSMADSTRPLTSTERRSMAGVLADPVRVAEGADGALYVLDRDFRKIVVFNRDGSLRRVILGGHGEGPGEFVQPIGLAVTESGMIAVTDMRMRRLTVFDTNGEVAWSRAVLTAPPSGRLVAVGSRFYWMLDMYEFHERPPVVVADSLGMVVDSFKPPGRMDFALANGSPGAVGRGSDDDVLFAHPSPGVWTNLRTNATRGSAIMPDMQPKTLIRSTGVAVPYTPLMTHGIAALPDRSILLFYYSYDDDIHEKGHFTGHPNLASFDPGGTRTGIIALPGRRSSVFSVSRDSMHVFLSSDDPYPVVVRYRVAVASAGN